VRYADTDVVTQAGVGGTEKLRVRRTQRMKPRELVVGAVGAALVLAAAGMLFAFGPRGPVDPLDFALLVLAMAVLGRLEFEVSNGFTIPTQLAFVPMLFVLPPAVVPLAVIAATVLDRIPDLLRGHWHPQRLLLSVGDAWFAIGPALVFVLAGISEPSLADWPIFALALGAQFAGNMVAAALGEWMTIGFAPRLALSVVWRVWLVDVMLSPIGLLAAYATVIQPHAYLLVLPLAGVIPMFARERRERIGHAIELSAAYRGTANLLGEVLTADDEYTGVHSQDVVVLALAIADELRVDLDERRLVEFGAMLHDIGKINTPPQILNKPGPLTDDEWEIMREHTIVGQRMLDRVGGTLHEVGRVVRASHERFDGGGYPDGLAGGQIPLAARIVAVADAYDAMTTNRPYRAPLPCEVALAELRDGEGTQFDPLVVYAAMSALSRIAAVAGPAAQAAVDRRPPGASAPLPRIVRAVR
jgi:putative nucleotidyltransferase with HDIG domain